ncbi:phage tail assembly protein T [Klebsiella aerogenes]|uniref:phage tail assembly protein T n=1 Tax=Klebsiella aerogenes TaxID=548 RepID=UPI0021AFCD01|nr:phage tail assembly protein T [Klebsiella aerogenes]
MLAGMTSSELGDWRLFYQERLFQDAQLDAHFSSLLYLISSFLYKDPDLTPAHFSLLSPSASDMSDESQNDEAMMLAAEGMTGGVRYGPTN